jgi:hypothetical protein
MDTLTNGIENAIGDAFSQFSADISEKHAIPASELEEMWNSMCKGIKISVSFATTSNTKTSTVRPTTAVKKTAEKKEISANGDEECLGCRYVWTKGSNGGTYCNSILKGSNEYCLSKHSKFEGIGQAVKKTLPQAKKSVVSGKVKISGPKTSLSKGAAGPSAGPPSGLEAKLVMTRNRDINNQLWHYPTKIVFSDKRVAIGKYIPDPKRKTEPTVVPLDDDDIEVCKAWGFKLPEVTGSDQEKEDSENESDDEIVEKSVDKKAPAKKPVVKAAPAKVDSDESSSEEEEEEVAPAKKPADKKADPKKAAPAKVDSDESSSEEEEEEVAPAKKPADKKADPKKAAPAKKADPKKAAPAKKALALAIESSEEEEEECRKVMNKASRSITRTNASFRQQSESAKKSIAAAISSSNIDQVDVEAVLLELQANSPPAKAAKAVANGSEKSKAKDDSSDEEEELEEEFEEEE